MMMAKRNKRSRPEDEEDLELVPGEEATSADRRARQDDDDDEVEIVRLEPNGNSNDRRQELKDQEELDFNVIDADRNAEEVIDEMEDYSNDEDVLQDLAERQRFLNQGSNELADRLRRHHSKSPDLSAGDIDAAWDDSDVSGEESVGGSAPTPDQDVVDELGEAFGINYGDAEPLHTDEKLQSRDRNRWELDPASAEDLDEQEKEVEELEDDEVKEITDGDVDLDALEEEDDLDEDEEVEAFAVDLEEEELEDELEEEDLEDLDDYDLEDDELDDYLDELYDDEDDDDDDDY